MRINQECTQVLAIDLGASGGRAMIGSWDGETIGLQEVHRFSNDPVTVRGTMYWDILRLFHEIKTSLLKARSAGPITSISVDTWGVDFGLLDREGRLLENPVHYRDPRTAGMLEEALKKLNQETIYQITGNQFMEINTLFQLLSLRKNRPELLDRADKLLMIPDLLHYFLCGVQVSEASIASTTQMFHAETKKWAETLLALPELPASLFCPIVPSGTVLGTLSEELCQELKQEPIQVIAAAGHDTASALAAVPAEEDDFLFLSSGTWSLLGTELCAPIINEQAFAYNMTNEQGFGGKTAFLKNIIGLWLIQESRRQWLREGKAYSFSELEGLAMEAAPFQCYIDPDDPVFRAPGNIPKHIREYCSRTGQIMPESEGGIVRCINESLAMKYRLAAEEISACTGREYHTLYMVGGGVQSRILCQMSANAMKCRVSAGPVEATVLGNVAVQLIALGKIQDLKQIRRVIRNSGTIITCEPEKPWQWDREYQRFKEVIRGGAK